MRNPKARMQSCCSLCGCQVVATASEIPYGMRAKTIVVCDVCNPKGTVWKREYTSDGKPVFFGKEPEHEM